MFSFAAFAFNPYLNKNKANKLSNSCFYKKNISLIMLITTLWFPVSLFSQQDTAITQVPDSTQTSKLHNGLEYDESFKQEVIYSAVDSQKFDMSKKVVYLYGDGQIQYGDIELKADYIAFYFEKNEVFASGVKDTSNTIVGKPIFKEGGQEYGADTIRYNFKTKKGHIKKIGTSINDGHVTGAVVKKTPDDVMYIKDGEYCPCDDKDAKTRIHINKIKIIPDEKIVTGPWNLKIGKVPTPLAFFMGYFPNNQAESAGILIPSYGENASLGFFLLNGGWYQPINDKVDLQLTGDIYSKGSWGAKSIVRYKNMYKYNGNFNLTFNNLKNSLKELPDFNQQKTFFVRWTHSQDAKARPNTSFSANVNAGSSSSFTNNFNSNINDYVSNTFQSSIRYSKTWPGKPFNLNIGASHNQNTLNKSFNINLPDVGFNMSRVYIPLSFLKSEKNQSKTKWYEQIGFNYSLAASNRLAVQESELRADNLEYLSTQMKNGIRHTASLQTSLKAWHFTINPSARFTDRMYFQTIDKYYNNELQQAITDTVNGFVNAYDYGFNTNITTKLYGMFSYKRGPVKAIRHVMIPSFGLNYNPAFPNRQYGYFGENGTLTSFSPYDGAIYGAPSNNESGGFNINLQNNLEMKVKSKNEDGSEGSKKIKLIESLNFSSRYDMFKDSIKWNDIAVSGRTTLFKSLSLNYTGSFDPYDYNRETGSKINKSLYSSNGQLVRMMRSTVAASYRFNIGKGDGKADGISKYVGLTANTNYNLNITRNYINQRDTLLKTQSLTVSGDLSIWGKVKLGYFTGYDFTQGEFTPTTFNLYVDLNCWEFKANFVPFGNRKSYGITLNMKSALLKDVKLERRRNLTDQNLLY